MTINLQATLSTSSAGADNPPVVPHHPLTCQGPLEMRADNSLACDHAQAPADDRRTQFCIDHSVAILLVELMVERERHS